MSAPIDRLLSRLERVRRTGPGQWVARCPAHDDKNPSLSIKQCDDGTILAHCFGGCDVGDILAAVGLEVRDLFQRDVRATPESRRKARAEFKRDAWGAALHVLHHEALVVAAAAGKMHHGVLDPADEGRLSDALFRIESATRVLQ